jgi:hypothetical protein
MTRQPPGGTCTSGDAAALARTTQLAERLRDLYGDDAGAAHELDTALRHTPCGRDEELAYAVLVRAELAERLGQPGRLQELRGQLQRIELTPAARQRIELRLAVPTVHERPASSSTQNAAPG